MKTIAIRQHRIWCGVLLLLLLPHLGSSQIIFDFEDAIVNDGKIIQTVNGINITLELTSLVGTPGIAVADGMGLAGSTGQVASFSGVFTVKMTFDASVIIDSFYLFDPDNSGPIQLLSPNLTIAQNSGITHQLTPGLFGITTYTINVSGFSASLGIDNITVSLPPAMPNFVLDNIGTHTYRENDPAIQIDDDAILTDANGDPNWNGGSLKVFRENSIDSHDEISILDDDGDGIAITLNNTDILSNGIDIGDLNVADGIVTGGDTLLISFGPGATSENAQEVLRSIRFRSTSETLSHSTHHKKIRFEAEQTPTFTAVRYLDLPIIGVNDAPTFRIGNDVTSSTNLSLQTVSNFVTNINDLEGHTSTFNVTADRPELFLTQPAINVSSGNLTFRPSTSTFGKAIISVTLSDNAGTANGGMDTSPIQTFSIFVIPSDIKINELDADATHEFVEIYDGGGGNRDLSGLVLVWFNGNGDISYKSIDINGSSGDNGLYVLGASGTSNLDQDWGSTALQNGPDAVALYLGSTSDFPANTPPTQHLLVDAWVYGTSDPDDSELLTALGESVQHDENVSGNSASVSLANIQLQSIEVGPPTPGEPNPQLPWIASTQGFSSFLGVNLTYNKPVQVNASHLTDFQVKDAKGTEYPVLQIRQNPDHPNLVILDLTNFSNAIGDLEVTYTNNNNQITDLDNRAALSQSFGVNIDFVSPSIIGGTVDELSQLSLKYSEALKETIGDLITSNSQEFLITDGLQATFEATDFSLSMDNDSVLVLTVNNIGNAVGDITIVYDDQFFRVADFGGNQSQNQTFMIDYDAAAPGLMSAIKASDTQINLFFSEAVQTKDVNHGDFMVVDGNGTPFSVIDQTDASPNDNRIELIFSDLSAASGSFTITYTNNNDEVEDFGNNALATDLVGIVLDLTPPQLTSAKLESPDKIVLTFNESVLLNPVNGIDFTIRDESQNSLNISSLSDGTPGDNKLELQVTNLSSAIGDLTITYTNSNSQVQDQAGNVLETNNTGVIADITLPTVTNITSSLNDGSYGAGQVIPIDIVFSETVEVTGTPQLTLETGTTDQVVDYASGSGSNTLTFNYTVQAGDEAMDLDYTSASALSAGTSIRDLAGNDAILTLPNPGATNSLGDSKEILIDAVAPIAPEVTDISDDTGSSASDGITNDNTLFIFGTAEGGSRVEVFIDGVSIGTTGILPPSGDFGVSHTSVNLADGTYAFTAVASDAAGNSSPVSSPFNVVVDTDPPVAPSGLSISADTGPDNSDGITRTSSQIFRGNTLPNHEVEISLNGTLVFRPLVDAAGEFSYNRFLSVGNHEFSVIAIDEAGNAGNPATFSVTVETTPPQITNVTSSLTEGTYGEGAVVPIQVTYDENVFVTGTPELFLATGNNLQKAAYVSGSGTNTLTFDYTVQAGDESADLDYLNSSNSIDTFRASIQDLAGNSASKILPNPGEAGSLSANKDLVIDGVAPVVPVITSPGGATVMNTDEQTVSGTHPEDGITIHAYTDANNDGIADNTTSLASATVASNTWNLSLALTQDSENNFVVRAEDVVSNISSDVDVPTIVEDSTNPQITNNGGEDTASLSHAENGLSVTSLTATDANQVAFNITGGVDQGHFELNGVELRFKSTPDFESPMDDGSDNTYVVEITATDDAGNADLQIITVTIMDVEEVPPVLTAVGRNNDTELRLMFSEPVQLRNNNPTGFQITDSNGTNFIAGTPSDGTPGDNIIEVSVNDLKTVVGELTVKYVNSNNEIVDIVGNALETNMTGVVADITPPTMISARRVESNRISITFNEIVERFGGISNAGSFSVTDESGTILTTQLISDANKGDNELELRITDLSTAVGDVLITFTQVENRVLDLVGNSMETNTVGVTADLTDPMITGVTSSTDNGTYGIGQTIQIQMVFSELVTVTGVPQLTLATGVIDRVLDYISGSGTNTLNFSYTIGSGDESMDLDYLSSAALTVGISIQDAAGHDAILTLPSPGAVGSLGANKDLVIDGNPPSAPIVTNPNALLITNATDQAISGTHPENGVMVHIYVDANNDGAPDNNSPLASTTVASNSWSLSVSLTQDAVNHYVIQAEDAATNLSAITDVAGITEDSTNPIITSNGGELTGSISVVENQTSVTTITATDTHGIAFSISGGTDQNFFELSGALLSFKSAPDFEAPTDDGSNNTYLVEVTATDEAGNTDQQAFTITISDEIEPANFTIEAIGNAHVAENDTYMGPAPVLSGDTPIGSVAFSLGGPDAENFTIGPSSGIVSMIARDFETPVDANGDNAYELSITATDDDENSATISWIVTITDVLEVVNFSIEAIADVSIVENTVYTGPVPTLSGETPSGSVTYTLGGIDAADFTINVATGVVNMIGRNFESPEDANADNIYEITITCADMAGNSDTASWTVTITDAMEVANFVINDIADVSVEENTGYASIAPSLIGNTPIGNIIYSLVGADAEDFTIDPGNGIVNMVSRDFESSDDENSDNTYEIGIKATDSDGNEATETWSVTITDQNDNVPTITSGNAAEETSISISENQTNVTTISATDVDVTSTISYTLSGGSDQSHFSIESESGLLSFVLAPDFENPIDQNTDNEYMVEVSASDGLQSDTQTIRVTVTDLDEIAPEPPILSIISNDSGSSSTDGITNDNTLLFIGTAEANSQVELFLDGTSLGTTNADASGNFTYDHTNTNLVDGTYQVSAFATDGAGNKSEVSTTLQIVVDSASPVFTLSSEATELVNGPFDVSISSNEKVSRLSIDDFSVTNGQASNLIETVPGAQWIVSLTPSSDGTIEVTLPSNISSDVAGNSNLESSNSITRTFDETSPEITSIQRVGPNPIPTATSSVNFQVSFSEVISGFDLSDLEVLSSNTAVAKLGGITEMEVGLKYNVEVIDLAGEGTIGLGLKEDHGIVDKANNKLTTISNNEVYTTNFLPTDITLSPSSIIENNALNDLVGTLGTVDPDDHTSYSYALVSGSGDTDNNLFTINEEQLLANTVFDFETQNTYTIRVETHDGLGGRLEKSLSIAIEDVAEASIAVTGNTQFEATALSFSQELTINVANTGQKQVEISITSVPSGFSITPGSISLDMGADQDLIVRFTPTEVKTYSGEIVFTYDGLTESIEVSGEGNIITSADQTIIRDEHVGINPNPAERILNIDLSKLNGRDLSVRIIDANGQIEFHRTQLQPSKLEVDVSTYAAGIHLIAISSGQSILYKKIIIRR